MCDLEPFSEIRSQIRLFAKFLCYENLKLHIWYSSKRCFTCLSLLKRRGALVLKVGVLYLTTGGEAFKWKLVHSVALTIMA